MRQEHKNNNNNKEKHRNQKQPVNFPYRNVNTFALSARMIFQINEY